MTNKEPWQMTWLDYREVVLDKDPLQLVNLKAHWRPSHSKAVEQALSEGKPVPPEVLKDYPELAKLKPPVKELSSDVGARKATEEGLKRIEDAKQELRDVINNPDLIGKQRVDTIANRKQLIGFLEANADTRKPLMTDYSSGDKIAYTGVTTAEGFQEFIYLDGYKAGAYGVKMSKEERQSLSERHKQDWQEQQADFRKLKTTVKAAQPKATHVLFRQNDYVSRDLVPYRNKPEQLKRHFRRKRSYVSKRLYRQIKPGIRVLR